MRNKTTSLGISKKEIITILLLAAVVTLLVLKSPLKTLFSGKNITPTVSVTPTTSPTITKSNGIFNLNATYLGNSQWKYTITGQLPTPCETAVVDALVAESYPEQVTIRVITSNAGGICAQVIKDFTYEGTFSASEKATVTLSINK